MCRQRERGVADAERGARHHPGHGDQRAVSAAPADRRDREADQRAVAADDDHHAHRQQARRRDHHVDDEQLRDDDVLVKD